LKDTTVVILNNINPFFTFWIFEISNFGLTK